MDRFALSLVVVSIALGCGTHAISPDSGVPTGSGARGGSSGSGGAGADASGSGGAGGSAAGSNGAAGASSGCKSAAECAIPAICKVCPDGGCAPVSAECQNGQCMTLIGDCSGTTASQWYETCGDPVCRAPAVDGGTGGTGLPKCDPGKGQTVGEPCDTLDALCDPGLDCGQKLQCTTGDPTHGGMCPISRARYKTQIEYLDASERERLARDLETIPLVRYRYKDAPERTHVGFIIEDVEPSPSVDSARDRVDLYGYTSMAVAAIQEQRQQIDALRREVDALRAEVRTCRQR